MVNTITRATQRSELTNLNKVTSKNLLHGRFLWLISSASLSNLEIHTVNALSAYGGKRCGLTPSIWYKSCTKSARVPVFKGYHHI